ncbi:MAG: flagellar FlbD family protein [Proteobacteria bacterium]|nr:flagellar FlbD family protein [Pseudomonadota bacterium]
MIRVTRLDNSLLLVSLDAIKYIEATPDSVISFLNGDSLIVRESLEEIDSRVLQYRVNLLVQAKAASSPK